MPTRPPKPTDGDSAKRTPLKVEKGTGSNARAYVRPRLSIPAEDHSVIQWLENQINITDSLRIAVREFIERHGYDDATCLDVQKLPRRGRPPQGSSDGTDNTASREDAGDVDFSDDDGVDLSSSPLAGMGLPSGHPDKPAHDPAQGVRDQFDAEDDAASTSGPASDRDDDDDSDGPSMDDLFAMNR